MMTLHMKLDNKGLSMMSKTILPVEEIEATAATQVRVRIDPSVIAEYAEDMKNGAIFPPITVFAEKGSERYILADGFHRLAAAEKAKLTEISVDKLTGGLHDALLFALKANSQNGLRRSNADKAHAVDMALKDPAIGKLSLRDIADVCCVSPDTVRLKRQAMNETAAAKKAKNPAQVSESDNHSADKDANNNVTTLRPTKSAPTQGMVDKSECDGYVDGVRAFPYSGFEAPERMGLTKKDLERYEYAADWLIALCDTLSGANDET